jgi:hypothetical protein
MHNSVVCICYLLTWLHRVSALLSRHFRGPDIKIFTTHNTAIDHNRHVYVVVSIVQNLTGFGKVKKKT